MTRLMQPKVYNRDGKELGEFPKGDMYIRDMKNTKGRLEGVAPSAALLLARTTSIPGVLQGMSQIVQVAVGTPWIQRRR